MIIENKNWFKNTFLLSILFILLIFLLTVMLEFYLSKFIGLGEPVVYDQSRVWGYSPKPNKKYERFEGDLVTINDVGLRSTKSWKNETKLKLLFLGDSVLYGGSNINDDQLFSLLSCNDIPEWSCFNGGVNAFGILNMVARSRFDKRIKDADAVVFVFSWADFLRGLQQGSTAHFILTEPPSFFPATWEAFNYVASLYAPLLQLGKQVEVSEINEGLNDPLLAATLAYDNLKAEVERLKSLEKKVFILSVPKVNEIKGERLSWVDAIENQLKSELGSYYQSILSKELIDAFEKNNNIFYDSVHLEEEGHVVYGKIINKILLDKMKLSK